MRLAFSYEILLIWLHEGAIKMHCVFPILHLAHNYFHRWSSIFFMHHPTALMCELCHL